jgi:hypothetical protein
MMRMMALLPVQGIYRLSTCVRALFHVRVDADAYLPYYEHEFRCPLTILDEYSELVILVKIKSVCLVQSFYKFCLFSKNQSSKLQST